MTTTYPYSNYIGSANQDTGKMLIFVLFQIIWNSVEGECGRRETRGQATAGVPGRPPRPRRCPRRRRRPPRALQQWLACSAPVRPDWVVITTISLHSSGELFNKSKWPFKEWYWHWVMFKDEGFALWQGVRTNFCDCDQDIRIVGEKIWWSDFEKSRYCFFCGRARWWIWLGLTDCRWDNHHHYIIITNRYFFCFITTYTCQPVKVTLVQMAMANSIRTIVSKKKRRYNLEDGIIIIIIIIIPSSSSGTTRTA